MSLSKLSFAALALGCLISLQSVAHRTMSADDIGYINNLPEDKILTTQELGDAKGTLAKAACNLADLAVAKECKGDDCAPLNCDGVSVKDAAAYFLKHKAEIKAYGSGVAGKALYQACDKGCNRVACWSSNFASACKTICCPFDPTTVSHCSGGC